MIISENLFKSSKNNTVEMLKQHFPQCFDKNGHFLPEKMAEQMQSQGINTSREYYTMNWLGKAYARYLRDCSPTTLLAENVTHNSLPENQNSQNLLIKGDNLEVLKHLKHAYANQVKMIYIDPPYNTGSDGFVYQDNRKFTPEQLSELTEMSLDEAKRVLNFTSKKSNSHSAWLTFMYPRLYIARELLKDDGVIFISIDDNEQAQLKLLCDEVFGEDNFVSLLSVENNPKGRKNSDFISISNDYCLIYAKNRICSKFVENIPKNAKDMTKDENGDFIHSSGKRVLVGENNFNNNVINFTSDKHYSVYFNHTSNKIELKAEDDIDNIDLSLINKGYSRYISFNEKGFVENTYTKSKFLKLFYDGALSFSENKIHEKNFSSTIRMKSMLVNRDYRAIYNGSLIDYKLDLKTTSAGTLLNELFLTNKPLFSSSKHISFLEHLVTLFEDRNFLILDFFAGSGTTAHAVMELNAEDGGHRQCICVQLPEPTNEKSEAYKAGYKTIFNITKARIEKAAQKIKSEYPDYQGDLGFKIFETVDDFLTVSDDEFNPKQLNLPETLNRTLSDDEYHTLLTTWRLYDGQALTEAVQAVDLGGYFANWCDDNVYLIYPYFGSEHIKALLHKLDNDKAFLPRRIVLFGRNIDSAKQMELYQAIKTYSNKKNIELNLVVRY